MARTTAISAGILAMSSSSHDFHLLHANGNADVYSSIDHFLAYLRHLAYDEAKASCFKLHAIERRLNISYTRHADSHTPRSVRPHFFLVLRVRESRAGTNDLHYSLRLDLLDRNGVFDAVKRPVIPSITMEADESNGAPAQTAYPLLQRGEVKNGNRIVKASWVSLFHLTSPKDTSCMHLWVIAQVECADGRMAAL